MKQTTTFTDAMRTLADLPFSIELDGWTLEQVKTYRDELDNELRRTDYYLDQR